MLIGIVYHTTFAFIVWPGPVRVDGATNEAWYDEFFHASHGFRMPLFFLLSGYLTALYARRRGLVSLVRQRFQRILVPLVVFGAILIPLLNWIDGFVAHPKYVPSSYFSFHHLWFLWFLWWFALAYVAAAITWQRIVGIRPGVARWGRRLSLLGLALMVVVSWVGQFLMGDVGRVTWFGPEIQTGWLTARNIIAYYGAFFVFGALAYSHPTRRDKEVIDVLSARWAPILAVTTVVTGPLAFHFTFGVEEGVRYGPLTIGGRLSQWTIATLLQVGFAWGMIFGLIGLAGVLLGRPRPWVRYLSDSAYWLYLVHLPLVHVGYWWVAGWPIPNLVKFILVAGGTIVIGLVTYSGFVRYSPIGHLLNGRRRRSAPVLVRAKVEAA